MDHEFVPVVMEHSLAGRERALAEAFLPAGRWLLVSDPETHAALGERVAEALGERVNYRMLASSSKPRDALAHELRDAAAECSALIAVGSGTINDLCKYAAFLAGKPYAVFATAPSMNGYVSANASIIQGRFRTSLAAKPPVALFCDLRVLCAAPKRLIRSGLGDSLCRSTAQADWLLSHHLLGTPYDPRPFEWLAPYEARLFAASKALVEGDPGSVELLMRTLIASGEGMRLAGGSYPASQGEHMIAHTLEMMGHAAGYHGEEIGVTTLTMAERQQAWLAKDDITIEDGSDPAAMRQAFGDELAATLLAVYSWKRSVISKLDRKAWRRARAAIRPILIPASELRQVLERCAAPSTPAALGWDDALYRSAYAFAPFTRDRFTFLDIA